MYFLENRSFLRRVIVCLSKNGVTPPMTEEPYHFRSSYLQPENCSVIEGTECSVEITNKMQPCNRIYYSTAH